jgi:hypothetical protein
MQRTGIVDKTVDREFDEEYERYKTWVIYLNDRYYANLLNTIGIMQPRTKNRKIDQRSKGLFGFIKRYE